jgi:gluconolactonase
MKLDRPALALALLSSCGQAGGGGSLPAPYDSAVISIDAAVVVVAPTPPHAPVPPPGPDAAVAMPVAPDAAPPPLPEVVPRCPPGPFPAPVVGASETVCADFKFGPPYNEGPTWVAGQGAFYFSVFTQFTGKGGDIIKYTPGGGCELFLPDVGCNGLAVTPDGNIVAACHQNRAVVKFDLRTKQATTLADSYMGQMLDTPNDLVVHSNGTIYFTNPPFELAGRPRGVGIPIFRIDPAGVLHAVAEGKAANGIGLAPDEKRLYALQGGIWDLDPQGVPSNQRASFVGGDGMAVDCAGNVYASGRIVGPDGKQLGTYPGGTNLTFGGADGKLLLVVGGGNRVRVVHMNLPGLP